MPVNPKLAERNRQTAATAAERRQHIQQMLATGLTRKEAAKRLNITRQMLHRILSRS